MDFYVVPKQVSPELAELLLTDAGKITPVPYALLSQFPRSELAAFCHMAGVYQVPTTELINYLSELIGSRDTIEVGAGNGVIGRHLGIKMIDSYLQTTEIMKEYHEEAGQPVINYGEDVQRNDANRAVKLYKPHTVVGCWITGRQRNGKPIQQWRISDINGIDEPMMFKDGIRRYIHVGVDHIHFDKLPLLAKYNLTEFRAPWIMSRSLEQDEVIYIFEK